MVFTAAREKITQWSAALFVLTMIGFVLSFAVNASPVRAEMPDDTMWDKVAVCETHADWDATPGGGLGISPASWAGNGGTQFAPTAGEATKSQQVYIAKGILFTQGWNAWAECADTLDLRNVVQPDHGLYAPEGDVVRGEPPANLGGKNTGKRLADGTVTTKRGVGGAIAASLLGGDTAYAQPPEDDEETTSSEEDTPGDDDDATGNEDSSSSSETTSEDADDEDSSGSSDSSEEGTTETRTGEVTTETTATTREKSWFDPYGRIGEEGRGDPTEEMLKPEHSAPSQYAVNAMHMDRLEDATRYLGYSRWRNATEFAPKDTSGQFDTGVVMGSIGSSLLGFSMGISEIIGQGITLVLNVNLIGNGLYVADLVFARMATSLIGEGWDVDGKAIGKMMTWIFMAIIIYYIILLATYRRVRPQDMAAPIVGIVLSVGAITFLGRQAAQNHASLNPDGALSSIGQQSEQLGENPGNFVANYGNGVGSRSNGVDNAEVLNPTSWATMSPGWMVAWANQIAKSVGAVVGDVTTVLFTVVTNAVNPDTSWTECDLYVDGMHAVFMNTPAARGNPDIPRSAAPGRLLMEYDSMIMSTVYKMWAEAAFGSSRGAGGAWCRAAEQQALIPAAEQAMISRVAGLYSEVVGTGGLGMVDSNTGSVVYAHSADPSVNGREYVPSNGTLVRADGNWNTEGKKDDPYVPLNAAKGFFGPTMRNKAGASQSKFYFAGCDYTDQGKPVKLRTEWQGVIRATDKEPLSDKDCSGTITNGEYYNGGFGQPMEKQERDDEGGDNAAPNTTASAWNYSVHEDDSALSEEQLEEEIAKDESLSGGVRRFMSKIASGLDKGRRAINFVLGTPVDSPDELLAKFDNAEQPGVTVDDNGNIIKAGNAPRDYWEVTNQRNSSAALALGAIALLLAIMFFRVFIPILIGAVIGQMLSIVFIMLAVLLILFAFIEKVRNMIKTVLLTVAASLLIVSILQIMMNFIFNIGALFVTFFGTSIAPQGGLFRALVVGGCYIAAFKIVVEAASRFMAMDMRTIRGGVAAGIAAGSPVLGAMRENVVSPLDSDFWGSRKRREAHGASEGGSGSTSDTSEEAYRAVLAGSKQRRARQRTAEGRRKVERDMPFRTKSQAEDKDKSGVLGPKAKNAVKDTAKAAIGRNPYGKAALVGASALNKTGKAMGKTGAQINKAGKFAGKNVAGAFSALDKAGRNGSNSTPLQKLISGKSKNMPANVRTYRGTGAGQSSGGNFVDSGVKEALERHPIRALKEGGLTGMMKDVLGIQPQVNESQMGAVGSIILTEATIEDALLGTPGIMDASEEEMADNSNVSASERLQPVQEARQNAWKNNPVTAASGQEAMSREDLDGYLDRAGKVGSIGGADRPMWIDGGELAGDDNVVETDSGLLVPRGVDLDSVDTTVAQRQTGGEMPPPKDDVIVTRVGKRFDSSIRNLADNRVAEMVAQRVPGVTMDQLLQANGVKDFVIDKPSTWAYAPGELRNVLLAAAANLPSDVENQISENRGHLFDGVPIGKERLKLKEAAQQAQQAQQPNFPNPTKEGDPTEGGAKTQRKLGDSFAAKVDKVTNYKQDVETVKDLALKFGQMTGKL